MPSAHSGANHPGFVQRRGKEVWIQELLTDELLGGRDVIGDNSLESFRRNLEELKVKDFYQVSFLKFQRHQEDSLTPSLFFLPCLIFFCDSPLTVDGISSSPDRYGVSLEVTVVRVGSQAYVQ